MLLNSFLGISIKERFCIKKRGLPINVFKDRTVPVVSKLSFLLKSFVIVKNLNYKVFFLFKLSFVLQLDTKKRANKF